MHAHLWSEDYLRLLESYGRADTGTQRGLGAGDSPAELDARFAMNDAAGIDHQILSVSPQTPYFPDETEAVTAARLANDHYAEVVRARPDRFSAFAALPLPHLDASLEELARALDQLGMAGAGLTTSVLGRSLGDPLFRPLFEELDHRDSVLSLHPAGRDAGSPLIERNRMRWMVGAPTEDTICAMHLILEGVPSRFPRLRIVHAHLGGALPLLLPRAPPPPPGGGAPAQRGAPSPLSWAGPRRKLSEAGRRARRDRGGRLRERPAERRAADPDTFPVPRVQW
ncbi:amidohydrolase family protein [[Kitasatospora] papulosa]|uniref:amidohydrolase family protein n=1 Tax=[Kitasatospora] papulosa TaxID=1464011 RepID=UPI0036A56041